MYGAVSAVPAPLVAFSQTMSVPDLASRPRHSFKTQRVPGGEADSGRRQL